MKHSNQILGVLIIFVSALLSVAVGSETGSYILGGGLYASSLLSILLMIFLFMVALLVAFNTCLYGYRMFTNQL
jgi:hypothetical protein